MVLNINQYNESLNNIENNLKMINEDKETEYPLCDHKELMDLLTKILDNIDNRKGIDKSMVTRYVIPEYLVYEINGDKFGTLNIYNKEGLLFKLYFNSSQFIMVGKDPKNLGQIKQLKIDLSQKGIDEAIKLIADIITEQFKI